MELSVVSLVAVTTAVDVTASVEVVSNVPVRRPVDVVPVESDEIGGRDEEGVTVTVTGG